MHATLKVDDMRRPIETNIFCCCGAMNKKNAFLAPPSCLSGLCFGRERKGGGGRGEGGRRRDERSPAGTAGPARGEAHQKMEDRAGSGVGGVALLWRQAPPLLWWPMIAARRQAQPPCVHEGARARGKTLIAAARRQAQPGARQGHPCCWLRTGRGGSPADC
jgi:hypothetical protein